MQDVDNGNSYFDIAKKFSTSKVTIGNIVKKRSSYEDSNASSSSKRLRKGKFPQLDAYLNKIHLKLTPKFERYIVKYIDQ